MKTAVGAAIAAFAASACCIGPVALVALGAGGFAAGSTRLEPYRPWLLGLTAVLLGAASVMTYRPRRADCADGTCAPTACRNAKVVLWLAVALVILLAAFPYYVQWFV